MLSNKCFIFKRYIRNGEEAGSGRSLITPGPEPNRTERVAEETSAKYPLKVKFMAIPWVQCKLLQNIA